MIIGLTGGIASGKSESAKYFKELGVYVIDADEVSCRLTAKGTPALNRLAKSFGRDILCSDKTLNKRKLADMIFSDETAKLKIKKILHPAIIAKINETIARRANKSGDTVIDAPLLFETGLDKICDKVVVVWAPYGLCLKRLVLRNGLDKERAKKRIDSQMPLEKKIRLADFVIDNANSKRDLKKKVKALYKLLTSEQK